MQDDVPELGSHKAALEFLSNLTPNSYLYNQTVQKLRRNKRDIDNRHLSYFHKKINTHRDSHDGYGDISNNANNHTVDNNNNKADNEQLAINKLRENETMHLNRQHHHHSTASQSTDDILSTVSATTSSSSSSSIPQSRKINTEKYGKKLKNYTKYKHKIIINSHNQTPMKISTLILHTNGRRNDCGQLSLYALLTICVYIAFTVALYNFLFLSESAVFTVAVMSAALPVSGIFWSVFELTTMDKMGKCRIFGCGIVE